MATLENNLYPPIVSDFQPAFDRKTSCKIYFSLSKYNNLDDIKNVQISVINQKTNMSALNTTKYPSGIKIATINQDSSVNTEYKYYIQLTVASTASNSDVAATDTDSTGYFKINQYYMVQMRFTHNDAPDPPSTGVGLDTWLFDNKDYFSEWSTICLIKGIDPPLISIANLNSSGTTSLTSPLSEIAGRLYYQNSQETEYLKSYNIKVYKTSVNINNLVFLTEEIYTNPYNPNEFNCEIPYDFEREITHVLVLQYTTNNSYVKSVSYKFNIAEKTLRVLDGAIIITPES